MIFPDVRLETRQVLSPPEAVIQHGHLFPWMHPSNGQSQLEWDSPFSHRKLKGFSTERGLCSFQMMTRHHILVCLDDTIHFEADYCQTCGAPDPNHADS